MPLPTIWSLEEEEAVHQSIEPDIQSRPLNHPVRFKSPTKDLSLEIQTKLFTRILE